MSITKILLEPSWLKVLAPEFNKQYMQDLKKFLQAEQAKKKVIYPKNKDIFNAFNYTPLSKVKLVILGQDPYHGPNQAHGLSFSVPYGIRPPPSLLNIYKELQQDLGVVPVKHGCLIPWAQQGVLLLNSVLTVEKSLAASHQNMGWENFTDAVMLALNKLSRPLVFLLWGSYAHKKSSIISNKKHILLKSVHPSPLSAHRGFLGCKHFSQANQALKDAGASPINWQLPASL